MPLYFRTGIGPLRYSKRLGGKKKKKESQPKPSPNTPTQTLKPSAEALAVVDAKAGQVLAEQLQSRWANFHKLWLRLNDTKSKANQAAAENALAAVVDSIQAIDYFHIEHPEIEAELGQDWREWRNSILQVIAPYLSEELLASLS